MSDSARKAALKRLQNLLHNPEHRSVDGHPQIRCKNGHRYEVQIKTHWPSFYYAVSRDFGCTAGPIQTVKTLDEVLDIILKNEGSK